MYSYIKGTLEEISEGWIVVENHGIGYHILTPGNMTDYLPSVGMEVKIYTYLQGKEDGMSLFGFPSKDGIHIFQQLLKVNGVGPKSALGILSVLSADELRFAVLGGDVKSIAKAPGIGAKSAQRIILELKDKLKIEDVLSETSAEGNIEVSSGGSAVKNEALEALRALGYSSSEALNVIAKIEITKETDVESLLKEALKQMAFL